MVVQLPKITPYALLAGSVLMSAAMGVQPLPDKPVAALFPPWWSATRVIASAATADGAIIRFGRLPTMLVLAAGGPALTTRLRRAGAWLVVDAGILGACAAQP